MPTIDEVARKAAPLLRRMVDRDRERQAAEAAERDEEGAAA